MSFHTLNYSSHVLGNLKTYRTLYGTWPIPVRAISSSSISPSSIILESDNLPYSKKSSGLDTPSIISASDGFLLNQQNAVGIIGGVSVDSALNFVRKLMKWSSNDEEAGLSFVLCSDPLLNKDILQHERSSFSCCIAMPCHISHSWYDEVSKGCSISVLHMGECVARERV